MFIEFLRQSETVVDKGLAGGLGFEPRLAESESAVLPLDDPPTGGLPITGRGICVDLMIDGHIDPKLFEAKNKEIVLRQADERFKDVRTPRPNHLAD